MAVTACRIGRSPLWVDWSHLSLAGKQPQHGASALEATWKILQEKLEPSTVGFYDCPQNEALSQLRASQEMAEKIHQNELITDCLFLGIGGSALGPISLLSALPRDPDGLRFHFIENPDPIDWNDRIQRLDPDHTLVVVITKSGGTLETISQAMIAWEWLGPERWKSQAIAITDPKVGDLRIFAEEVGMPTLPIHPSIGGRYSVFSPVGLFPLALAKRDAAAFLNGATLVREYFESAPAEKNAFFQIASTLVSIKESHPVHVWMPYSTRLRLLADWWVQLWGESLGKDGQGFSPIGSVGATDQHSLLQLLRDGPDKNVTFFLQVDEVSDEVRIPEIEPRMTRGLHSFQLLQKHTLHELISAELHATLRVLVQAKRPNLLLRLKQLDETALGALCFATAVLTAYTGELLGVNPFDQPGVEEGKGYLRQALSEKNLTP